MISLPEVSIIIPTYNEADNLELILKKIAELRLDAEIIIVDDDSPDGTGDVAEELKRRYNNLHVIHRKERGLASAVVEGFKAGSSEIIGVIDADLSHPPETIPKLIDTIKGESDLAIGSRYIDGGGIEGWNLIRKITSRGAVLLARPLTSVKDSVSGFFFLKRDVIKDVTLDPKGYKIGLEILVKGSYSKVVEIPYVFTNRKIGKSKLNLKEYINYIHHLISLYKYKIQRVVR
jgi:dolichol-phosphate mannosyltransferase